MLKVSSRGHYGLRMMTELARAYGHGPLSLTEVAQVENLPPPYLEQLIVPLRKAGLVEGTRGPQRGYQLTQAPAEVTAGAVLRALEGPISLVECTAEDYVHGACSVEGFCMSSSLWHRIKVTVEAILDRTSLDDLLNDPTFAPGYPQLPAGLERLPVAPGSRA